MTRRAAEAGASLLEAALQYAARGWPVFPLKPGGKTPITKNGLLEATVDPAKIRRWWKDAPAANIGIATGKAAGIWVLDADKHEKADGAAALADLEFDHDALPETLTQLTPSGGHHRLFRYNGAEIRNSAGRIAPGIDVRGDGGYIVAPPSVHPNGGVYRWSDAGGPDAVPVADAPSWLIERTIKKAEEPAPSQEPARALADHERRYVDGAFGKIIAELSSAREGARNDALNKAAFAFGQFVGCGALSQSRCEAALLGVAMSLGLPHVEAERTIRSGIESGVLEPRSIPEPTQRLKARAPAQQPGFDPATGEIIEGPAQGARASELVWFADIAHTLSAFDFIEGLLCSSAMSVIYGEPGCGKTFFATDLALHVALGRPWMGREVDQGGVVYVALEGGHGIKNRIAAFRQHYGLEDARVPFALVTTSMNLLDALVDTERLIGLIAEAAATIEGPVRLVVIDTLSRALAGGNENAPDDMGALVMNAGAVIARTAAHVLFIHHSGKDSARGARGHTLLLAAVDTEIQITKDEASRVSTAIVTKQKDLDQEGEHHFSLAVVELGNNHRGKAVTSCVVMVADAPDRAPVEHLNDSNRLTLTELRELVLRDGKPGVIPEQGMVPVTAVKRDQVRDWFITRGILDVASRTSLSATERSRFARLLNNLKALGKIGIHGDWIWPLS